MCGGLAVWHKAEHIQLTLPGFTGMYYRQPPSQKTAAEPLLFLALPPCEMTALGALLWGWRGIFEKRD